MTRSIECPVCEARFVEPENHGSIQCPECTRVFPRTAAVEVPPPSTRAVPGLTPPVQRPAVDRPRVPVAVPVVSTPAPALPGENEPATGPPAAQPTGQPDGEIQLDSNRAGRRVMLKKHGWQKNVGSIVAVSLLSIIALGLMATVPFVLKDAFQIPVSDQEIRNLEIEKAIAINAAEKERAAAAQADGSMIADVANPDELPELPGRTADSPQPDRPQAEPLFTLDEEPEEKVVQRTTTPPAEPTLNRIGKRAFDLVWRRQQRRIVRLIIDTPQGSRHATGTIIDTRGWVVTSFRAVAGAQRITAEQTASNFEEFSAGNLLADEVRGVIATDPDHDIAILSVNRRLVLDFSTPELAADDNLVGGMNVIQFGFQETHKQDQIRSPLVAREAAIVDRKRVGEFSENAGQVLNRSGLQGSTFYWILHQQMENASSGSPLFDSDEILTGMNTNIVVDGKRLVCSGDLIRKLVESSADELAPVSTLSADLARYGLQDLDPANAVPVDSPFHDTSIQVNRTLSRCEEFNFVPLNNSDYQSMQNLIYQMDQTRETEEFVGGNDAAGEKLAEAMKSINQQMSRNLIESASNPTQVAQINRLAIEAIQSHSRGNRRRPGGNGAPQTDVDKKSAALILCHANVLRTAIQMDGLAGNEERVAFQITGNEKAVIIPWNNSLPVARPETKWVLVFRNNKNGKRTRIGSTAATEVRELILAVEVAPR